jgi:hypothetical protein
MVQCRNRHRVSHSMEERAEYPSRQCMLPAKVLCTRGFLKTPKKPLDMLRTSDPLSLLNEHTLATHPNNWKAQTTPANLLLELG